MTVESVEGSEGEHSLCQSGAEFPHPALVIPADLLSEHALEEDLTDAACLALGGDGPQGDLTKGHQESDPSHAWSRTHTFPVQFGRTFNVTGVV